MTQEHDNSNDPLHAKKKAWSGRFSEPVDAFVLRYTASVDFDKRMAMADIDGSLAHAAMLAKVGVITEQDLADIRRGMAQIREEITSGAIPGKAMSTSLSIGVAVSIGLAMTRVLTGISIFWFLIPGYLAALILSFLVPSMFTAIAFDSGGVASGPMTATFLLPLAQGACVAVGGNIVTDAFGVVAMVAMTPLITVQLMGLMAQLKQRRARQAQPVSAAALAFADLPDDAIIEL